MKKVRGKTGNVFWYPKKVAVFHSLFSSLKTFLNSENFRERCERWRKQLKERETDGELRDIYDGKVWEEFQNVNGKPFQSQEDNFAIMLNVDWFNPFKHSPGFVGAFYCLC